MKYKKKIVSGIAAATAGVLGIGALIQTQMSVQASSAMMPGIETIVSETSEEKPFRILEIVDNTKEAELGWYVSGQEPYLKLYQYLQEGTDEPVTFSTLEEGLSKLPTARLREEFMKNVKLTDNEDGTTTEGESDFRNVYDISYTEDSGGNEITDYPLSYREYQEQYFFEEGVSEEQALAEGWKRVDFSLGEEEIRTDTISGHYEENTAGTGDYTQEEQTYYPIRQNTDDESNQSEKFRENIQSFFFSEGEEASAPYLVKFQEVSNDTVNNALGQLDGSSMQDILKEYDYTSGKYGYFENVYTDLTVEIAENIKNGIYTFPGEMGELTDPEKEGKPIVENTLDTVEAFDSGVENDAYIDVQEAEENVIEDAPEENVQENIQETVPDNSDPFSSGDFSAGDGEVYEEPSAEDQDAMDVFLGAVDSVMKSVDVFAGDMEEVQAENAAVVEEEIFGASSDSQEVFQDTEEAELVLDVQEAPVRDNGTVVNTEGKEGTLEDPFVYLGTAISEFPYYKYETIGDLDYIRQKTAQVQAADQAAAAAGTPVQRVENDITVEGEQYWIWRKNSDGVLQKELLSVVTGRQAVPYSEITRALPQDLGYNYYFRVQSVSFCCELPEGGDSSDPSAYSCFGWYYPTYPADGETYLPAAEDEAATYYVSNAEYSLTPGEGNFDFVPGTTEGVDKEHKVSVNHLYYRGGFTNHDWLKRYVFHLSPDAGENASEEEQIQAALEFESFDIQVDTLTTEEFTELGEYDLIYLNGSLTEAQARLAADSNVPVIINQGKALSDSGSGIGAAFSGYMKETDADAHYVTQNVYFFNGKTDVGDTAFTFLANLDFHTDFNPDTSGSEMSDGTDSAEGFEEILEYIESENQYRSIGASDTGDSGEKVTDGAAGQEELLTMELSQARAIEYILNFRYKRVENFKEKVNVLEIQPAALGTKGLQTDDVYHWLGYEVEDDYQVEAVCSQQSSTGETGDKMNDGFTSTMWHTQWNGDSCDDGKHWMKLKMEKPSDLSGFVYVPRQSGGSNGMFTSFTATFYNEAGEKLYTCEESGIQVNMDQKEFRFDPIENVSTVEFTNITGSGGFASCAELYFVGKTPENAPEVNITSMTSSEFVGNIEDLNTKYDLIYWGGEGRVADSGLAVLTNGEGNMLYTHVGGAVAARDSRMQGIMDIDYDENGRIISSGLSSTGTGSVRGSGNDITMQQVDALVEFARSGYPFVISGNLYKEDGSIDREKVDDSSYVYILLEKMEELKKNYKSICTSKEAESENLNFFVNLPKPVIAFTENGIPASAVGDENGPSGSYISGELRYSFSIEDEAQSSVVNSTYNCQLFVDLNSDGNFSSTEELEDIQVTDAGGNVLQKDENGRFSMKQGEAYTVTRSLPANYVKLITWKLKVSNNSRPQIWTTSQGYCKQEKISELPTIRVLQIYSSNNPQWILTRDRESSYYDSDFNALLSVVEQNEFKVQIDTLSTIDYVKKYKEKYAQESKNILDDYDMLIIGFADMYSDIENGIPDAVITDEQGNVIAPPGAVDAILNFIQDGKSVLFAHDTTSFFNNFNVGGNTNSWGKAFNSILRQVVGLDRYGITNPSISTILKRGMNLVQGTEEWNSVLGNQSYDQGGQVQSDGDVAFVNGSGRTEAYGQTQGFTSSLLMADLGSNKVNTAVQVNEGAITEYPFKIPDTLTVATTHGQYYQLALEEDGDRDGTNDIIAWYCLGGSFYNNSPKDVRNNYYIYSKGNVMYTGVGHSDVKNGGNNRMEKALFVNAIVASYRASAVDPKVQFVDAFSRNAQKIQSDYYMTDQYAAVTGESNVIDSTKTFYFTVDDYNLIASNDFADNKRSLDLELYIADEGGVAGSVYGLDGISEKVSPLNVAVYQNDWKNQVSAGLNGKLQVYSGNVYAFSVENLEKYVKTENGGYKNNVKLYAKISTSFTLYGRETSGKGIGDMSLKQRQLFDMD